MDNTKKMLRTIINGQSAMKSELVARIDKLDKKIDGVDKKVDGIKGKLSEEIKGVEKRLTARIDKIGLQVARLEDDAPTRDEHDQLEKRVIVVEQKVASL